MSVVSRSLTLIVIGCVSSCSPVQKELGTLPVDSLMIEIMVDIHLMNARAELGYGGDELPMDTIIARHGLSRKDYDRQITFYTDHPDTYLAVLNKVTERIGQDARLVSGY